ncbi:MAG: hypothetical protein V3V59_05905 [Thermodesulfovibrionales bacterium]
MTVVLFSVFVVMSLFYIFSPMFSDVYWPYLKKGMLDDLQSSRTEGIWAISDVDSEYEMGKLTKDEHAFLRKNLKEEVVPIIKQERDILKGDTLAPKREISRELKENIIKEVIRICGKNMSS